MQVSKVFGMLLARRENYSVATLGTCMVICTLL